MIGQVDIRISAHRPNMPLNPVFSFKGSPSSIRLMDVPKKIGTWDINRVYIKTLNPDNETSIVDCVRSGSVWVGTFLGCDVVGKVKQGIEVLADGIDEKGEGVTGYVLGIADYIVMDKVQNIDALVEKYNVRFLDELPPTASKGDLVIHNGSVQLFDGVKWVKVQDEEAMEEINERLDNLDADVAELNEDVGQVKDDITSIETKIEDIEGDIVEVKESIPTKTSELENDSITPQSIGAAPIYAPFIKDSLTVGLPDMPCVKMYVGDYESGANLTVDGGANVGGTINVEGEGAAILINNKQVATIDLINQKINNQSGLEAGKTIQVVEVEDEPVARGASLQSVSPRATSTHLEWAAVDPITKTSQLENDSGFITQDEVDLSDVIKYDDDEHMTAHLGLEGHPFQMTLAHSTQDSGKITFAENAFIDGNHFTFVNKDTYLQLGGNLHNGYVDIGPNIHINGSTEEGKSNIMIDGKWMLVQTPPETKEGQTLQAVKVYDGASSRATTQDAEPPSHIEWEAVDAISKTSQLDNDSGYITIEDVPEQSTTTFRTWED